MSNIFKGRVQSTNTMEMLLLEVINTSQTKLINAILV